MTPMPSSSRMPIAHRSVSSAQRSHRLDGPATLTSRPASTSKFTEQRAKSLPVRPVALERTRVPQPPLDRDSTRVLAMPSGRFGVIFARDADGNRLPQRLVNSESHANELAREFRRGRDAIVAFVVWLAGGAK